MSGGSERKVVKYEKTNPSWKRCFVKQMLQNTCQQRRVLLHQLRHYRHQYHLFSLSFLVFLPKICQMGFSPSGLFSK
ncbi:hypothetical protein OIU76_025768 [Salix suchowensis]|nr:hypothetical protein OIU76_025768 [Salix suchowensis]